MTDTETNQLYLAVSTCLVRLCNKLNEKGVKTRHISQYFDNDIHGGDLGEIDATAKIVYLGDLAVDLHSMCESIVVDGIGPLMVKLFVNPNPDPRGGIINIQFMKRNAECPRCTV